MDRDMIETINHAGVTCWCDGFRQNGSLAFLSLFGPQNAVRAVWASLMGKRRGYVQVAGNYVSVDEEAAYVTIQRPFRKPGEPAVKGKRSNATDMMHLVTLHPAATNRISGMADEFIVLGDEPQKNFWSRLNRLCRVPFRREWSDRLWDAGLNADFPLIKPLGGFGLPAFHVDCQTEGWHEIAKEIIRG